jgi:hypothetical protein
VTHAQGMSIQAAGAQQSRRRTGKVPGVQGGCHRGQHKRSRADCLQVTPRHLQHNLHPACGSRETEGGKGSG